MYPAFCVFKSNIAVCVCACAYEMDTAAHTQRDRHQRGQGLPSMQASLSYRTRSINPETVPANLKDVPKAESLQNSPAKHREEVDKTHEVPIILICKSFLKIRISLERDMSQWQKMMTK